MAYDPHSHTSTDTLLKTHFQHPARAYTIPDDLEPELKYILPHIRSFREIFDTILSTPQTHTNQTAPLPNNYVLLSIGLDTISQNGYPTQKIATAEYQYRVRTNLSSTYHGSHNATDSTIKCRTHNTSCDRIEIETQAGDLEKKTIPKSLSVLKKRRGDKPLPPVFTHITDHDLRVEALCLTSRSNFFFEFRVQEGLIARYHACADQNLFLTPHADTHVGGDLETEFEIYEFISDEFLTPEEVKEKIILAQDKLDKILRTQHGSDISPSPASKLVRAANAVSTHYQNNNPNLQLKDARDPAPYYTPHQWALLSDIRPADLFTKNAYTKLSDFFTRALLSPDLLLAENIDHTKNTQKFRALIAKVA